MHNKNKLVYKSFPLEDENESWVINVISTSFLSIPLGNTQTIIWFCHWSVTYFTICLEIIEVFNLLSSWSKKKSRNSSYSYLWIKYRQRKRTFQILPFFSPQRFCTILWPKTSCTGYYNQNLRKCFACYC